MSSDSSDTQSESGESSNGKRRRQPIPNKAKRQLVESATNFDEKLMMEKAMAIMDQKPDELEVLGQFVASELRQMPNYIRNIAKTEIMKLLMHYGPNNMVSTYVPHSTSHSSYQNNQTSTSNGYQTSENIGTHIYNAYSSTQNDENSYVQL